MITDIYYYFRPFKVSGNEFRYVVHFNKGQNKWYVYVNKWNEKLRHWQCFTTHDLLDRHELFNSGLYPIDKINIY